MATSQSLQFVQFTFPPSKPPFYKSSPHWSSKPSGLISSLNASDSQTINRPTATFSRSKYQTEAGANTTARAAADTHLPSLEKQSLAGLHPKIPAEASNARSTLQSLEQSALHWPGLQVNRTQRESGEPQDGSRDPPTILDNNHHLVEGSDGNETGDASSDCDTGHITQVASLHDTFTTSELASEPHGVPSTPAQAPTQTLPQPSKPVEAQITQQDVNITQRTSVDSALPSITKASDRSDDEWTDKDTTKLEHALELALGEQPVEPLSVDTSATPSPHSVEALQDEIESRERGITEGILKELRDVSRRGSPAQDLEWCKQRETQVEEGGTVALQQQGELAQPPVGDVQDLVEVEDANDHEDKEATEALPAAQPKIDEQRFRLRGVRTRQLPGRQTKTTQYRLVRGQRPNKLDSWLNEDDVQISMPYVSSSQDLALPIRVRKMRSSQRGGRKVFEYLVDAFGLDDSTWTTEDQLRISLSPMLVLELKGSSPHPLSEAQRDVLLRQSVTPIRNEHGSASRTSRSSSASADPALGEPATRKRAHQGAHIEINSDTHYSTNTDDNRDTDDEDPRPAKRRKPRSALAVTPPPHVRRSCPFESTSTTSLEIDEMQLQADFGCPSTLVDDEHHYTPQTSRSPPSAKSVPITEYQEWPFQGFLKRTRIGNETTYNLEFQLSHVPEHLHLPVLSEALGMHSNKDTSTNAATSHNTDAHSKVHSAAVQPQTRRRRWTPEEDATILKMKEDSCSWEEIHAALPRRTQGTIQVRYSTKLKK